VFLLLRGVNAGAKPEGRSDNMITLFLSSPLLFHTHSKNKSKNGGVFLGVEKWLSKHHISPPNHHNFTTI
jgi:hypothetical protein